MLAAIAIAATLFCPFGPLDASASERGLAAQPICDFGRQLISELPNNDRGPTILSARPVAPNFSRELNPAAHISKALMRAWKRQKASNLLDVCPDLASVPGRRLAVPTDDVTTYGSITTVYYVSLPIFSRTGDEALVSVGFLCSGRCGGFTVHHYKRIAGHWRREQPLIEIYG